ncbi:MAG: hypothetical protein CVV49_16930 [Spirochaetae bacterium HGW-Spirochaetae-5]|nr:MAG: hypothetical protein CVV49_16930 [Spirochaetae bacterium HGW-Spirochaetae-5]
MISLPLKNFYFFGNFFLGVSIFLFAVMIYFAADSLRFIQNSVEAEGVIADYTVKNESDSEGRSVKNYYPLIEYIDISGVTHRFMSETVMNFEVDVFIKGRESGFTNPVYPMPKVKVRYLIASPGEARAARSFADLWGIVIAYVILSVIFALVGGTLLWLHKKNKK